MKIIYVFAHSDHVGLYPVTVFEIMKRTCNGKYKNILYKEGWLPPRDSELLLQKGKEEIMWMSYGTYGGKMRLGDHYEISVFLVDDDCIDKIVSSVGQLPQVITIRMEDVPENVNDLRKYVESRLRWS